MTVLFAANADSAELRTVSPRVNALYWNIILNNIFFHFSERPVALPMIFFTLFKIRITMQFFSLLFCVTCVFFFTWCYVLVSQSHGNSLLCPPVHPVLFMLNSSNGWNHFFSYAEGAVFDASQYAFFGSDTAVQEVELGGLDDDDLLESNAEFILNREEVNFHNYFDFKFKFCL